MWLQVEENWVNLDKVGGIEFRDGTLTISFLIDGRNVGYHLGEKEYLSEKKVIKKILEGDKDEKRGKN